jgi:hypothetical protein
MLNFLIGYFFLFIYLQNLFFNFKVKVRNQRRADEMAKNLLFLFLIKSSLISILKCFDKKIKFLFFVKVVYKEIYKEMANSFNNNSHTHKKTSTFLGRLLVFIFILPIIISTSLSQSSDDR